MTDVSEAEIEAATAAVAFVGEWFDPNDVARAALTAAAQVREREARDGFDYIVNCAKPNCDGVHGVEKLVDAPHGVPARDCSCHMADILATEPDSGPSVLGNEE